MTDVFFRNRLGQRHQFFAEAALLEHQYLHDQQFIIGARRGGDAKREARRHAGDEQFTHGIQC